jgi:signal transduction histidine kinase
MNSLEHRLHAGLALSLIGLMILLGWAQISVMQQLTESVVTARAEHDSQSLLASIKFDASGRSNIDHARLGAVYSQPYSGHYYQIVIAEQDKPLRSRSLWDTSLEFSLPALGKTHTLNTHGPDDQVLLIHVASYQKLDHLVTIAIAEDITPIYQQERFYTLVFIGLAITALLLILFVQRIIVQFSFRPLKQIQHEIQQLSEGQQGYLTEAVPRELRPLVIEINHLLLLMTQRLERSRNALGNLAHTLKGPLNLMVQMANNDKIKQYSDIHADLQEHTARMQQIINHELKRARFAGAGVPGQQFIPSEELPNLIKVLQRIYYGKTLSFDCKIGQGTLGNTDRDDMLELLGNLLDNSCKWAKSSIRCTIVTRPIIAITIEDDGPGCSSDQIELITQRGIRVDEDIQGHGLGLAIVKEIAQIYHFELHLDKSPTLGGLRVKLTSTSEETIHDIETHSST